MSVILLYFRQILTFHSVNLLKEVRTVVINRNIYIYIYGHAVAQLVEALRYKPKGRGFDSPIVSFDFFFSLT